jgi:hypothetical protein
MCNVRPPVVLGDRPGHRQERPNHPGGPGDWANPAMAERGRMGAHPGEVRPNANANKNANTNTNTNTHTNPIANP